MANICGNYLQVVTKDTLKMLSDLLRLGENAPRLAQTWGKCSQTSSDLQKMLFDLRRLRENAPTLAQTWGKCSQTCSNLGKMLSDLLLKKSALVSAWRGLPRIVGLLVHIPNKTVMNSPCSSVQNAWSFLS